MVPRANLALPITAAMLTLSGFVPISALRESESGITPGPPGFQDDIFHRLGGMRRLKKDLTQHIQSRPGYPQGYRGMKGSKEKISQHVQQKPGYPKGYRQFGYRGMKVSHEDLSRLLNEDHTSGQEQRGRGYVRPGDPRFYLSRKPRHFSVKISDQPQSENDEMSKGQTANRQPDPKQGSGEPDNDLRETQHPHHTRERQDVIYPKVAGHTHERYPVEPMEHYEEPNQEYIRKIKGHAQEPKQKSRIPDINHLENQIAIMDKYGDKAEKLEEKAKEAIKKAEAIKDKVEKLEEKAEEEHEIAHKLEDKAEKQLEMAEKQKEKADEYEEEAKEHEEKAEEIENEAKDDEKKAESLEEDADEFEDKAERYRSYRRMVHMRNLYRDLMDPDENVFSPNTDLSTSNKSESQELKGPEFKNQQSGGETSTEIKSSNIKEVTITKTKFN